MNDFVDLETCIDLCLYIFSSFIFYFLFLLKVLIKCVKLLFITIHFVGFYSVPNLIVIIFNLLYPVCIVGFHCKGCVIERVV